MKRIVQCPKCESKLAVFDIGKTITQKCPRCGTAFEIASEEKPGAASDKPAEKKKGRKNTAPMTPAAEPAPDAAAAGAAPSPAPAPAAETATAEQPAAKTDAAEAEKKPEDAAPAARADAAPAKPAETEKKEITLKKPIGKPSALSAPRPSSLPTAVETAAPAHGVSFMHIVVLFLILVIVIVAQVVSHKKTQARLDKMDMDIDKLAKQVQALGKK